MVFPLDLIRSWSCETHNLRILLAQCQERCLHLHLSCEQALSRDPHPLYQHLALLSCGQAPFRGRLHLHLDHLLVLHPLNYEQLRFKDRCPLLPVPLLSGNRRCTCHQWMNGLPSSLGPSHYMTHLPEQVLPSGPSRWMRHQAQGLYPRNETASCYKGPEHLKTMKSQSKFFPSFPCHQDHRYLLCRRGCHLIGVVSVVVNHHLEGYTPCIMRICYLSAI